MAPKIIVYFEHPPIPDRNFDYCAYYKGMEEFQHCGSGKTKEIAIQNLIIDYPTIDCAICGDWHEEENIPLNCRTGDGE